MTLQPLNSIVTIENVFFMIVAIIVISSLILSTWLAYNAWRSDREYRTFELPIADDFVIDAQDTVASVVNPLETTKFKISSSSKQDDVVSEALDSAQEMYEEKVAEKIEQQRLEVKRQKKQLKKARKNKK